VSTSVQPYLFQQIGLDSGSLTILGRVIHRFDEPGEFRGVCSRHDQRAGAFYLKVDKGSAIKQVNIDLATLQSHSSKPCDCEGTGISDKTFLLAAGGYAVFHVSGGPGGFSVRVEVAAGSSSSDAREFDSVELRKGDLFAATILRPGLYTVSNLAAKRGATVEVSVAYPHGEKKPFVPPPPVQIKSTERGFDSRGRVELLAAQGCVFVCEAVSRIRMELTEPYDPPAGREKR
jgi:hypothetical protein